MEVYIDLSDLDNDDLKNLDLIELMDENLDGVQIEEYANELCISTDDYTNIKEMSFAYHQNNFDLKSLIKEIGTDEVTKIIKQLGEENE